MTQLVDLKSRNLSSDSSGSLSLKSVSFSGNEGVSRTGCALKALRIVPFLPLPAPGGWQGARLMAASLSSVFKRERDCLLCLSSLPSVCFLKYTWCIWGQAGQSEQSPLNTLVLITSPADEMRLTPVGFSWVGLAQGLACSKYSMNTNFWWIESICVLWEKNMMGPFLLLIYSTLNDSLKVKIVQPCMALCNPMNYTVHGIIQARILEWAAFPFSRGSSQPRAWTQVSCIADRFFTVWANREAQEYWSG